MKKLFLPRTIAYSSPFRKPRTLFSRKFSSSFSQENYDIAMDFLEKKNYLKAKHYLSEACKLNHPKAFTSLGNYHINPDVGEVNPALAKEYYELGHELGDIDSTSNLGVVYESEGDYVNAELWLTKASDNGSSSGLCNLGLMHIRRQEQSKGVPLMEKAAKLNDYVAIFFMGEVYLYGAFGFSIDYEKAFGWFEKVKDEISEARSMIAFMKLKGYHRGVLNNNKNNNKERSRMDEITEAIDVLRHECQYSPGLSKALLGIIMCEGVDLNINNNNNNAQESSNNVNDSNNVGEEMFITNPSEGILLLSSSANEHENEFAMMTLSVYYGLGKYVQQDLNKSQDILQKLSSTYGNQNAKEVLKQLKQIQEEKGHIIDDIMTKCFEHGMTSSSSSSSSAAAAAVASASSDATGDSTTSVSSASSSTIQKDQLGIAKASGTSSSSSSSSTKNIIEWDDVLEEAKPTLIEIAKESLAKWPETAMENAKKALKLENSNLNARSLLLQNENIEKIMFPADQIRPPRDLGPLKPPATEQKK